MPSDGPNAPAGSVEQLLGRVVEQTSGMVGENFLRALVRCLATAMGMKYALVGQLLPLTTGQEQRVRALAVWGGERFVEPFDYPAHGTTCGELRGCGNCIYARSAAEHFPQEAKISQTDVQACVGAPLLDSAGGCVGILMIMHDHPINQVIALAQINHVLRVFAERAAAEMMRMGQERQLLAAHESLGQTHAALREAHAMVRQAYASLRETERRHLARTDASPVGIFHMDREGAAVYMNQSAAALVGLPLPEASSPAWTRALHPEDHDRIIQAVADAIRDGTRFRDEYRFVHTDGSIKWVIGQLMPERDQQGLVHGWAGTLTDITEMKQADDRLRQRERLYEALVEHSPVGIWQIRADDGGTVYMNPTMRRMLELDETVDVSGLTIYEFFTPEGRDRFRAALALRLRGLATIYEVEIIGRRGMRRMVMVAGAPVPDIDGVIRTLIGTFTDITERRMMERELRENANRLRLMTEQVPAAIWTTDLQLTITSGTGLVGRHAAQSTPDFTGKSLLTILDGGDPEQTPAIRAHRRALAGESMAYEQQWLDAWWQTHVEPLHDEQGAIIGVIGVALDVTDRKQAEDALRESFNSLELRVQRRTEQLQRANDTLRREIEERKKIEEALRQSQARYASILNSQQTLVSRSDMQGRITYVNAAHQRAFGSHEGDSLFVKVHPDDIEPTRQAMEALQRPPHYCTLEQRCEVAGQWRTFLWQVGVIRDRAGQITEYQGVGFDITDRHRAEELLRQSERRARDAAESNRRLVREVDHRVGNNLAGLLSLLSAMRESAGAAASGDRRAVSAFANAFEARLLAMVNVHQLLTATNWRPVDLAALLTSLLKAVERLGRHSTHVFTSGPTVQISARQASPLSMILLEWFTNSCKYGAHSVASGQVRVRWEVTASAPSMVRLQWTELGGPPIRRPISPSLGTELVQGFAARGLRGRSELRYPESGADHLLEFPLDTRSGAT